MIFYNPINGGHKIMSHHVAHFIRCQAAQMFHKVLSMDDTWDIREPLNAVGMVKEVLLQAAYIDMQRCLNFSNN